MTATGPGCYVHAVLRRVHMGSVETYGEVALEAGDPALS